MRDFLGSTNSWHSLSTGTAASGMAPSVDAGSSERSPDGAACSLPAEPLVAGTAIARAAVAGTTMRPGRSWALAALVAAVAAVSSGLASGLASDVDGAEQKGAAAKTRKPPAVQLEFPPQLPGGAASRTDNSPRFLERPATLKDGVLVAATPPTIDFLYYPGQNHPGNPWSNWGDSLAVNGKYYASIGDHHSPAGDGYVFEYDPATKTFRQLASLRQLLQRPEGHYSPAKIHSRLDLGEDGWLYFSTHRGSSKTTINAYHYVGDWILRCHPATGKAEVVAQAPVEKHCLPTSVLDPRRLIFYGGTAHGDDAPAKGVQFVAYDVRNGKTLYSGPRGPYRYLIFAASTGRVYYNAGDNDGPPLMRFDPAATPAVPTPIAGEIGLRAATQETPQGVVYTVSSGQGQRDAKLWAFDTRTEKIEDLGPIAVGSQAYVASIDADATGRYLYYVPGAHGGSEQDKAAVVQFDLKTKTRKVIAFLHPFYRDAIGCTLKGTYSTAIDPAGDKLYVTWNASRESKVWDCCVLTVIHIPASERP